MRTPIARHAIRWAATLILSGGCEPRPADSGPELPHLDRPVEAPIGLQIPTATGPGTLAEPEPEAPVEIRPEVAGDHSGDPPDPALSRDGPSTAGEGAPIPEAADAIEDRPEAIESGDGSFRIRFPVAPEAERFPVESPGGTAEVHLLRADDPEAGITMMLSYCDYPDLGAGAEVLPRLDQACEGLIEGGGWSVLRREDLTFAGHPGREVVYRVGLAEDGWTVRGVARLYLVGRRLYQVVIAGPASRLDPARVEEFLGSFRLIRPLPGRTEEEALGREITSSRSGESAIPPPDARDVEVSSAPDAGVAAGSRLDPGLRPAGIEAGGPRRLEIPPRDRLGFSGVPPDHFRTEAPRGGVLVGLRIGFGDEFGRTIASVQPVYRIEGRRVNGPRIGRAIESPRDVIAEPGFAVGALNVRADGMLDALQVHFHTLAEGRLDTSRGYASPWLGSQVPGRSGRISAEGRHAVGIHGRTNGREILALGLIVEE